MCDSELSHFFFLFERSLSFLSVPGVMQEQSQAVCSMVYCKTQNNQSNTKCARDMTSGFPDFHVVMSKFSRHILSRARKEGSPLNLSPERRQGTPSDYDEHRQNSFVLL